MIRLPISNIRRDGGTQARAGIDQQTVERYAAAITAGAHMPPVLCHYDGAAYWLADGFHRCAAAELAQRLEIDAEVVQGTQADAQWYSYGANKAHGLPLSPADRKRIVAAAVAHPNAAGLSDRQIATYVGCNHETVGRARSTGDFRQLAEKPYSPSEREYRMGADGKMRPARMPRSATEATGLTARQIDLCRTLDLADRTDAWMAPEQCEGLDRRPHWQRDPALYTTEADGITWATPRLRTVLAARSRFTLTPPAVVPRADVTLQAVLRLLADLAHEALYPPTRRDDAALTHGIQQLRVDMAELVRQGVIE